MLAPGYYLWRNRAASERAPGHLLAIVCCLVLLFPVISASDDLRSVGTETEECCGNRITKSRGGSVCKDYHSQPVSCVASSAPRVVFDLQGVVALPSGRAPQFLDQKQLSGRDPPLTPVLLRDTQKIQIFYS
jgi:hypothetical protein